MHVERKKERKKYKDSVNKFECGGGEIQKANFIRNQILQVNSYRYR